MASHQSIETCVPAWSGLSELRLAERCLAAFGLHQRLDVLLSIQSPHQMHGSDLQLILSRPNARIHWLRCHRHSSSSLGMLHGEVKWQTPGQDTGSVGVADQLELHSQQLDCYWLVVVQAELLRRLMLRLMMLLPELESEQGLVLA